MVIKLVEISGQWHYLGAKFDKPENTLLHENTLQPTTGQDFKYS